MLELAIFAKLLTKSRTLLVVQSHSKTLKLSLRKKGEAVSGILQHEN